MKKCSQCGAVNADESRFCNKCGSTLGESRYDVSGATSQCQFQQPNPRQPHATMGFGDAIRVCMKEKYASFQGRATRAEYWFFALFCFLVLFGAIIVGAMLGAALSGGDSDVTVGAVVVVYFVFILAFICPSVSVAVRRLHDTGRSGWWYFIGFVPYVGGIVLFVFALLGSQEHDNEYGPYVNY